MSDQNPGSVLISGVGVRQGLGAAIGYAFAAEGYHVVVSGRNRAKLEATVQEAADLGVTLHAQVGDVAVAQDVARFVAAAEALGPLTVAVHNAGDNRPAPFLQVTPEAFEEHWRSHSLGGFLLAQAVLPGMLKRQTGTLIYSGATGSLRGRATFSPFAAAKSAVRMTAQSLAREFGPQGIHVAHVVIDGAIDGDRIRTNFPSRALSAGVDGMLHPDEIAKSYVQLHRQHRSAWTQELDLRPWLEQF